MKPASTFLQEATAPEPGTTVLLTSKERQELAILAREAWLKMTGAGATDESFDEFRHRIAIQACGRRITEAIRSDFNLIKAAFAAIVRIRLFCGAWARTGSWWPRPAGVKS